MQERPNISDKYQHLFYESTYDDIVWDMISRRHQSETSLTAEQKEELYSLDDQLQFCMWLLIDTQLSTKQRAILQMLKIGMTQTEMAEELGINQSSIHKALHGNVDYQGGVVKRFGGIAKRLEKLIRISPDIHEIMEQIDEKIDYIDKDHSVLRLPHYFCFKRMLGNHTQYENYIKTAKYITYGSKT